MDNFLYALMSDFERLPSDLRENICRECAWSVPTFYRKLKRETLSKVEINFVFYETRRMLMEILKKNEEMLNDPSLKMKRYKLPTKSNNKIKELSTTIFDLQYIYRRLILDECDWSAPTFTIKKLQDKIKVSNVEKRKIITLFIALIKSALVQTKEAHKHYINIQKALL